MFLGYSEESKAYRIWDFTKEKVVITRDVICNEHDLISFPYQTQSKTLNPVTVVFNSRSLPSQSPTVPSNTSNPQPATSSRLNQLPNHPPEPVSLPVPLTAPVQIPPSTNVIDNPLHEADPLDQIRKLIP